MTAHLFVSLLLSAAPASQPAAEYDLVIYGGNSAGIVAALQGMRQGLSVALVCPETHLGGLSVNGLGWTDTGDRSVIGGLARAFYQRVKRHYDQPGAWRCEQPSDYDRYRPKEDAQWTFEPHVAEAVFEAWLQEQHVPVFRDAWLDRNAGVLRDGGRITALRMIDGTVFRGRMFIDATYEGDLLAAAGVPYTVGREANAQYNETLNGVQVANARAHQFTLPVDPYVVPGDPQSGLLPRVHAGPPGVDGSADRRVQAYCFRMCLTDDPENRVPFPQPADYDARQYELLARYFAAGSREVPWSPGRLPNRKTDTNNNRAFSTDNIGESYDYPEASYARRRAIIRAHARYQQGLMWFLANDARVPDEVRREVNRWGLARDEFTDNGHWPYALYIREARRMVSDFVVTERHLRRQAETPRPVGMGSYNMDSHNVQRYVDGAGHVRNEGDVQVNPGGPYPIDYGALIPKVGTVENLLVPVCVSTSHIAYGSIRMEPVFMILGQSAATAAAEALERGVSVQAVDYDRLRKRLLADGQILSPPERK